MCVTAAKAPPIQTASVLPLLDGWRWGHDGTLDYSREDLLPRGPLPSNWMDYHGHYLNGDQVVLHYAIDGRDVWQHTSTSLAPNSVARTLHVGPGKELVLCVAEPKDFEIETSDVDAENRLVFHLGGGKFVAAMVIGGAGKSQFSLDGENRIALRIPESDQSQIVKVVLSGGNVFEADACEAALKLEKREPIVDPQAMTRGGELRWPNVLTTTGYRGLEQGGYALDTLTIPNSTPWNTWFRTSALDFFPDGRMALATYGGDVWIVSGIDDDLLELKWKRFAGGLYEPFGLKIVDDQIFVTCKDRLNTIA